MRIYIYRWKVKKGYEKQFEENWAKVTEGIYEECGSLGSRLHYADGVYLAYAQWPADLSRSECNLNNPETLKAKVLYREAVEEMYPDEWYDVKVDLLHKNL